MAKSEQSRRDYLMAREAKRKAKAVAKGTYKRPQPIIEPKHSVALDHDCVLPMSSVKGRGSAPVKIIKRATGKKFRNQLSLAELI